MLKCLKQLLEVYMGGKVGSLAYLFTFVYNYRCNKPFEAS